MSRNELISCIDVLCHLYELLRMVLMTFFCYTESHSAQTTASCKLYYHLLELLSQLAIDYRLSHPLGHDSCDLGGVFSLQRAVSL